MIIGNQKQIQYLKKIFEKKKIPQAFLFVGQKGLGKKKVALEFISWIFGQSVQNHPDFILIEPIAKQIQIDQIRELNWKLSLRPFLAKIKAAVIDSAHLMTKDAQNCFLKTLEEPSNSLIILISEFPALLLPTIISRCQTLKFFPAKKQEIENYLIGQGLNEEKIKKILEISQGRPGIAISLIENLEKLEKIENAEKNFEKINQASFFSRFNWLNQFSKELKFEEILEIFVLILRKKFFSTFDLKTFQILKELQKIQIFVATTNVDQKLSLENLLLKI